MVNLPWVLLLVALVFLILSAMGKLPLWPAVLVLILERAVMFGGVR